MSEDPAADGSSLIQVMAWCRQAAYPFIWKDNLYTETKVAPFTLPSQAYWVYFVSCVYKMNVIYLHW